MPTRSRRKPWKPDSKGQYTRQIGWKRSKSDKRVQAKFRFGEDLREALLREERLKELWSMIEEKSTVEELLWDTFTLQVAKQLARGAVHVEVEREPDECIKAYARRIYRAGQEYPMLKFFPADQSAYVAGANIDRAHAELKLQTAEFLHQERIDTEESLHQERIDQLHDAYENVGVDLGEIPVSRGPKLHEAMEAYIGWIEKDYFREDLGDITANAQTKIRQVNTLMGRHDDIPIADLGLDAVERMFQYWRQRPRKKGATTPISRKSASNYIGELKRFLNWLHKSTVFDWRKPDDFDDISTKIDADVMALQSSLSQVATFSIDDLVLLNRYATPLVNAV